MKKFYFLLIPIFILGCQKEELPILETQEKSLRDGEIPFSALPPDVQDYLNKSSWDSKGRENSTTTFGPPKKTVPAIKYTNKKGQIDYTISLNKIPGDYSEKPYFDNMVISKIPKKKEKVRILRYLPSSEWFGSERNVNKFSGSIEFYNEKGKFLGKLEMLDGQGVDDEEKDIKGYTTTCTYTHKNTFCVGESNMDHWGDTIDDDTYSCTYNFYETCTTTYSTDSPDTGNQETENTLNDGVGGGGMGTTPITNIVEITVELKGKELCVYNRLQWAGVNPSNGYINMMTQLFIEFGEGNIGGADLIIREESLAWKGGDSNYLENGVFEIIVSNMGDRSSIEIAAVLVHEMAHAFLAKHYVMYNSSFKELYQKYINDQGLHNYSHDIMKDKFINRMAQILYDYDSFLFPDFEDYKALASYGVFDLNEDQLANYNRVRNYAKANDDRCDEE